MKRSFAKLVLCSVIFLVFFTISSGVCFAEKPINLLFAGFEPPQGPYASLMPVFADEIAKKTNGRVKVQVSVGGALGKPGEFFSLTSKGICDMAFCVPAFGDPGTFPMSEIIGLPWVAPRGAVTGPAVHRFQKKGYLNKEFSDVKLLACTSGHGEVIFMKDTAATSIADLKGKKIWSTTPVTQHRVKLMGAVPVALPMTDMYSALQKGIMDGATANWQFLFTFKLAEVLNYAISPFGGTVMVSMIMNEGKWESLPPDIRDIFMTTADDFAINKLGQSWDAACDMGEDAFLKRGGKKLEWDRAELTKLNELFNPIWNEWIANMEKRGLPGEKAVDDFYQIWVDLGVDSPAVGYTP